DKKELEIVRLYYFEDMNQREIAEIYNTSQVQISKTLRRAINKLKETTKNTRQNILSSKYKNSTSLYHEMEVCQC
ncbi:sigma-70 family RNA polymerase sigma factor, partial [Clostridium neonatale]